MPHIMHEPPSRSSRPLAEDRPSENLLGLKIITTGFGIRGRLLHVNCVYLFLHVIPEVKSECGLMSMGGLVRSEVVSSEVNGAARTWRCAHGRDQ